MRLWLLRQAHPDLSKLELEVSTSCLSKISLLRLLLGQTNRDKDFPESLRYSERPNIPGNFSHLREQGQPDPDGAFQSYGGVYGDEIVRKTPDKRPYAWETVGFLASRASNLYSDSVATVQPAGVYVQMLIRYAA